MNREVEERLVAMYFDNRDFEKNAKQTIETLDQLKKSMNLEDSVKGFDMFDRMKRNAGMEQMQRSANKLKETFGSVGTTLNKAFQIGTGPLRQFENTLGTMRSYISRYLGFDFASKVVNSVESAVRGLTLQPISQGWGQYEAEVDSVRTIMSSTGRSIDDVTKNLDDLRTYADKTVYSLTDMTSNLGKFTNNGVELEKATQAMMGVANAAALAGQGTQQASMAMYNISQAIGVGKMTSIDWKSIENANMATKDLKQTFIEVAAAQDNLKKVEKDGVTTYYYVKDSNGREIKDQKKWVEVNYKNFRETLSKGWLTSDTLTTTLAALSGQSIGIDEWAAMGIEDKELIKTLEEMGQKALEAASQVRTFSKMMTTLKDSVASGWSQSFKFVFGNADEATEFWTSISERIGGVLNESANARNKVLKKWKETREVLGTGINRESLSGDHEQGGLVEYTIYGRNGREILIDGLKNLMDVFGELGKAVSRAFGDVLGSIGGEDLFAKTQAFEKLTIRLKEWLGTLDDSGSKLNKIYRIVRGVISGFKLWKNILRNAADTIIKLLIPGADGVLDILANLGDFLYDLANLKPEEIIKKIGEKLKQAWNDIRNWFTPKTLFDKFGNPSGTEVPIVRWFQTIFDNLKTVGSEILTNLGLGGFVTWLGTVETTLKDIWEQITSWEGWPEISKFLTDVWFWITGVAKDAIAWFTEDEDGTGTGFTKFLSGVWSTVQNIWGQMSKTATTIWSEISPFLTDIWFWITGKTKDAIGWFTENDDGTGTGFTKFLSGVWATVQTVWNQMNKTATKIWSEISPFLTDIWFWITGKTKDAIGWFTENDDGTGTGFTKFLSGFWSKVQEIWGLMSKTATTVWNEIRPFLTDIWKWITGKAKTAISWFTEDEDGTGTGFTKFLSGVWSTVQNIWGQMSKTATTIWSEISPFLTDIWFWITGKTKDAIGWFTENDDGTGTGFTKFLSGVWATVQTVWNQMNKTATKIWSEISPFLTDIWFWITGKTKDAIGWFTENDDGTGTGFTKFLSGFWSKVQEIWGLMSKTATTVWNEIRPFLTDIWKWITGKAKTAISWFTEDEDGTGTGFTKFLNGVWEEVTRIWNEISVIGKPIWEEIAKFLTNTWNWLLGIIAPSASAEEASGGNAAERITSTVVDRLAFWKDVTEEISGQTEKLGNTAEEASEDIGDTNSKLQPILSIFEKVGDVFEKIFGALTSFFKEHSGIVIDDVVTFVQGVGTALSGLFDALGKIFTYFGHKLKGEKNMRTIVNANGETEEIDADVEALSHIMEAVKTIILEILKLEGINVGAGAVKGIIGRIFGASSIATDIRDIGMGIMMIFGTMAALRIAQVSDSDIKMYGKYFLIGSVLLAVIITAMSRLKKSTGDSENEPRAGERIATKAIQAVESVVMLAAAFKLLPEVIKAIGDAKAVSGGADLGMDILMSIVSVLGAMVIAGTAMAGMSWVADKLGKGGLKGLGYALLYIAAGVGVIAGGLAAINYAFDDEGGWEQLAGKAKEAREAIGEVFGIATDLAEAGGVAIGNFVGGIIEGGMTSVAKGVYAWNKYVNREELTDADKAAIAIANEQTQLQMVIDGMLKLAEILKSDDIANIKGIFSDLSNMSASGTFGQGLNLSNFSKGFEALATTLSGMASALTQNDSSLFKVLDDESLEAKLYKAFDALDRIMTIFNEINVDAINVMASSEFPTAFEQFSAFVNDGSFQRFVDDINSMFSILLTSFPMDYMNTNEGDLNRIFKMITNLSDSIIKANEALDKLKELKDKYSVMTKKVAVLKDKFSYTNYYSNGVTFTHDLTNTLEAGQTISSIQMAYNRALSDRANHPDWSDEKFREQFDYTPEDLVNYYEDEIIDPGLDMASVLEEVLAVYDKMLEVFESHPNLTNGSYDRFAEYFGRLSDAFGMFTGEEGVGSAKWNENYNAFSKLVEDENFVEKYIENLDKVYSALKDSDIVQDDGVIEFNGVNIVSDLFTAIQDALYLGNLPDIDASPIITKIGEGLGLGKDVIAKAMALMIQSGVDQVTVGQEGGSGNVEIPQELIDVFTGKYNPSDMFGNAFGSLLDTTALNKAIAPLLSSLDDPNGPLNQAIGKLEEKMGATLDLSKFMDESGLMFEDENGKKVNAFKYIETLSNDISESLNAQDPIAFAVTPVFAFTDLTRENLQEQLNGLGLTAPVSLPSVGVNFTAMRTELGMDEIKQKLDAIKLAIDLYGSGNVTATSNLGIHMDGIRNEISGMNLVLDTGVLVGQMLPLIDVGLYNRALTQYRTGTAPRNGAVYVP